jgi:dipeptidyl-peptidase III
MRDLPGTLVDRFDEYQILRFEVPAFDSLTLSQKQLAFYLSCAGLSGRDIVWDQNFKFNLLIRRFLEQICRHYAGDRTAHPFPAFMTYLKRIWYSNGIHSRYDSGKHIPGFSFDELTALVAGSPGAEWPLGNQESTAGLLEFLRPLLFDPEVYPKMVSKETNGDLLALSAVNFYEGVSQQEAESFYGKSGEHDPEAPPEGLNAKLVKRRGRVEELPWRAGGLYGEAIDHIIHWLEKALTVAENSRQARWLEHLIEFYRSGDPAHFDRYSIAWVRETEATIDAINGFIETYSDPLGLHGSYEALVSMVDFDATRRIGKIAANASVFEKRMPWLEEYRNPEIAATTGTVIDVIMAAGDSHPWIPRGINLPNAEWIHEKHGSKSTNLGNIVRAGRKSSLKVHDEFLHDETTKKRAAEFYELSEDLLIDLHEVVGHGSGRLADGTRPARESLKNYANTLEEARADLVGLYFLYDPWLVELGLMPGLEVGRAQYDYYILKGSMLQLHRLPQGFDLEEDHMRAEALVTGWAFEQGRAEKIVERRTRHGKTYFVVNDYSRLRKLFGLLLAEIQRIKSEGDYSAGHDLVEGYGVRVDRDLHKEVLERYRSLDIATYTGFMNPKLEPEMVGDEIVDVRISYPADFAAQMIEYAEQWSFLPTPKGSGF